MEKRDTAKRRNQATALLIAAALIAALPAAAQQHELSPSELPQGLEAKPEELAAWLDIQQERFIRGRERAEAVLRNDKSSYLSHLVLGLVQHYAEANFPRALYHLNLALDLFQRRHGSPPQKGSPWRWYAVLLKELAWIHGDLEHYSEQIAYLAEFNQLYEPNFIAERAWPLMKLRRYAEARLAADLGLATDQPDQRKLALNALCAIEFESGRDQASYRACRDAVDDASLTEESPSAVDLTNFAEAARSLFKLDEAESIGLEATTAPLSWYGNPWLELAELYLREARLEEALYALKKIPVYRSLRPPHARDSDRNETRRAITGFLLIAGRPREAVDITSKALVAPDRRAHNSRDPLQDRMVIALLDRRARLVAAELRMEQALSEPLYRRAWAWLQATWLRLQAWRSGALAKRMLSDERRLIGVFQIGTARSAILPPWLAGELIEVLGAGPAQEAVRRARSEDRRAGSDAYYDAFSAEIADYAGDYQRALQLGARALSRLSPSESLLRSRVEAIAADAAWRAGRSQLALSYYDTALQSDRGVFRRLGLELPVRITVRGDLVARKAAALLASSPRIQTSSQGLELRVEADRMEGSVCLIGSRGEILGLSRTRAKTGEDADDFARSIARDFHLTLFEPPIDLSRTDINSLDGSNLVSTDTLQTLFGSP